ncbi:GGDEF domain-containing protein [Sedimentibacter saalensis]|uniref:Diguanylate cyclase (GGDEF)-like protein n=1 Tax=Sedimentibacter saalensis TaxID=130788 RepID=A0A562JEG3_9FIRM|nr:GGDEF domain-containing protein [Sedimentibacter saalensis]TWH81540.1 diguanylate cyclase (GGDEF)-like protein [Sedimentibacter saalensis]
MHKLYKPYLIGTIIFAAFLSILMLVSYRTEIVLLSVFIAAYGAVLEVLMLRYSQHSGASLRGTIIIFAAFLFNPATCVFIVTLSFLIETAADKLLKHENTFSSASKALYNWAMRIVSILTVSAAIIVLHGQNAVFLMILASTLHNTINASMLMLIIYLYTNNKDEAHVNSIHSMTSCIYISVIINILLYYGYGAYGINAVAVIFLFLLPFQNSIMGKVMGHEIETSVLVDSLTNVYNKASLTKILTEYVQSKIPFTLVFIDFDNFKKINDTYGHDVGDKILKHFAVTLKGKLRKSDKLYRFGGDEFCLVIDKECDVNVVIEKTNSLKGSLVFEENILKIPYSFTIGKYKYSGEHGVTEDQIISIVSHRMIQNKVYNVYMQP